jgi:hypothetical protein
LTDDNSTNENELVDMDDLDAFEEKFFERETPEEKKSEEVEEKVPENEDDPLAAEEDKDAPAKTGDEDEAEEDEGEDKEESEPEPKPKPKSKAQQRIEKLLERERLANDRANALEARLAALEAQKPKEIKREERTPTLRETLDANAPNPDTLDEDGNPVYALGEFDPKFISDLTEFTIDQKMQARQEQAQKEAQSKLIAEQQRVIQENWHSKLEAYEAEVPEVREEITDLVETFQNIEPSYGEYLASVIMANESGPQIMHYLSQNIGEAQKIVASGPSAATLAIGRLEARLSLSNQQQEEKRNTKRVSDAPPPPESRSRGAGGKFSVAPDTDDLDAFEKAFFKKH